MTPMGPSFLCGCFSPADTIRVQVWTQTADPVDIQHWGYESLQVVWEVKVRRLEDMNERLLF